jgi:colicin import membrane protein
MRRRAAGAVLAAGLLLAGCSSTDAREQVRQDVTDITAEANNGDADAVRRSVDVLLGHLTQAVADGELTAEEAGNIERIALAVQQRADLIDADLIRQQEAEAQKQRQAELERQQAEAEAEAERQAELERQQAEAEAEAERQAELERQQAEAEASASAAASATPTPDDDDDDDLVPPTPAVTASPAAGNRRASPSPSLAAQ